ncbi:drug/metabolite exporter YedA [Dyadobacter beijingensis]|uniref:Drug/metabolite exporter YedA n=1 Tax=Dyadobacter beijingensis TaxID=365489 RepID=A0ABQ2HV45_9BACT|nr:EamA family transporter [Dyadobacter beijingensis]GGM92499.1 drug/metabolite exporter YedA [Dyadobacter beijingensis]
MKSNLTAYIALILVCFFWGTTYLAARIGVAGFPALFFMGFRNVAAGALLLAFLALKNRSFPWTWADIRLQLVPGWCMITFGTGLVGWCVQYIPSGLAALLYATVPLFTIVVNLLARKEERINGHIAGGMLLGLAGVMLVFRDNISYLADSKSLMGICVTLASCVSWCLGGLYTKSYPGRTDSFFNAAIQMMAGGAGLFVLSALNDDWTDLPALQMQSLLALLYLIFFGSILAYASYLFAMSRLPAGLVSIYAYINPLVALVLGFLILDEKITWLTVLAFTVTISGVFLVNRGYQLQKRKHELTS